MLIFRVRIVVGHVTTAMIVILIAQLRWDWPIVTSPESERKLLIITVVVGEASGIRPIVT